MLETVQLFRAKVVDVAPDAVTIEVTGNADKLEAFLAVLEPFGIRELVQSGMVAIGRGGRSITDRTLRPVPSRPARAIRPDGIPDVMPTACNSPAMQSAHVSSTETHQEGEPTRG